MAARPTYSAKPENSWSSYPKTWEHVSTGWPLITLIRPTRDTAHPHTHVVLRGATHDGKALNIAGDYIAEGIRGRYEEIITHELGLKCEMDILDDLARETKLNRVTTLDRAIIPRIDAASSVIDLRAGSFRVHPDSALNRHLLIGRMKHLETLGLAQPTQKGLWQIERHAFDTLGDMHRNENITKEMSKAMKRAGIDSMMRLHGREAPHRKITGRVIGKGLAEDESSGTTISAPRSLALTTRALRCSRNTTPPMARSRTRARLTPTAPPSQATSATRPRA